MSTIIFTYIFNHLTFDTFVEVSDQYFIRASYSYLFYKNLTSSGTILEGKNVGSRIKILVLRYLLSTFNIIIVYAFVHILFSMETFLVSPIF